MIDEKKLIAEIEKLKSNLIHGACSSQVSMETRCKEEAYNEVLAIIDPLQEEPIDYDKLNSMLNDALSKETKESWNEMLGKEEPKKCMFAKDNYTDEDRKVLCEDCEEKCEYAKKKELVSKDYKERYKRIAKSEIFKEAYDNKSISEFPVSEDLEEAASEWDSKASFSPFYMVMNGDRPVDIKQDFTTHAESFKAGAQWQKQKDEHHIWQISSANYEKGKQEAREEMMKDAVDGEVTYGKSLAIPSLGYRLDKEGLDFGDKVKLIIIKEN